MENSGQVPVAKYIYTVYNLLLNLSYKYHVLNVLRLLFLFFLSSLSGIVIIMLFIYLNCYIS